MDDSDLAYQLRLCQLELMKANVLRETAEFDLAGIRVTQRAQKDALRRIKQVLHPARRNWTAVENIIKELGL